MKYAIVFGSKTGNTEKLAEVIRTALPEPDRIYYGEPDSAALEAEVLFVGFWTDKGTCDAKIASFLEKITTQRVFLFGTAGFGGDPSYFEQILSAVKTNLHPAVSVIGSYMCQGKMMLPVRQRYEKMLENPEQASNAKRMIENFDRALHHPDAKDLDELRNCVERCVGELVQR